MLENSEKSLFDILFQHITNILDKFVAYTQYHTIYG